MRAVVTDEKQVVDGKVLVIAVFDGIDAPERASSHIATFPEHDVATGRYGIDACIPAEDAHVPGCGCPGAS